MVAVWKIDSPLKILGCAIALTPLSSSPFISGYIQFVVVKSISHPKCFVLKRVVLQVNSI